jgi:glycosyltransferase involved in cell wall biosynthesis
VFLIPLLTLKENGGFAVVMAFARRAAAGGARIVIIASDFHGVRPVSDPENERIEFVMVPSTAGGRIGALVTFLIRAIAMSARHRPRLIYTHIATTLIPDFSGQRSFMIAQDIEYRFYEGWVRLIAKRVFARATGRSSLLVSSLWLARYFRRRHCDIRFAGDVGVERRFLSGDEVDHDGQREFDYLLIAKRGAHKRRSETLAVARLLAQNGHVVRLVDQAEDDKTPTEQQGLIISGAVPASAMRGLYRKVHVFVGVSRAEGYGLTPLEALILGCRVVTTPTPSTANLHHHHLAVVAGSDNLVARLVDAAETQLALCLMAGLDPKGEDAHVIPVPFMEDWSDGACRAFAELRH